jgi:hypothetical protein
MQLFRIFRSDGGDGGEPLEEYPMIPADLSPIIEPGDEDAQPAAAAPAGAIDPEIMERYQKSLERIPDAIGEALKQKGAAPVAPPAPSQAPVRAKSAEELKREQDDWVARYWLDPRGVTKELIEEEVKSRLASVAGGIGGELSRIDEQLIYMSDDKDFYSAHQDEIKAYSRANGVSVKDALRQVRFSHHDEIVTAQASEMAKQMLAQQLAELGIAPPAEGQKPVQGKTVAQRPASHSEQTGRTAPASTSRTSSEIQYDGRRPILTKSETELYNRYVKTVDRSTALSMIEADRFRRPKR